MSIYFLPNDPATPIRLNSLRIRARRRGYLVGHDRASDLWSLLDARLKRPLVGFDDVSLAEIARVILAMPTPKPVKRKRVGRCQPLGVVQVLDRLRATCASNGAVIRQQRRSRRAAPSF